MSTTSHARLALAALALSVLVRPVVAETTAPVAAAAKTFRIDPSHSHVGFSIRHLVSKVPGSFREVEGTLTTSPKDIAGTRGEVVIKTTSIDTGNEKRDGHLRSGDFFEVEKHPEMRFVIDSVEPKGETSATAKGQLTIRGVTKPVTLEVEDVAWGKGMQGKDVLGFSARTTINRKDYGIEWNRVLDTGGAVLGDDVRIQIDVEAVEVTPEQAGL